jgi:preprotein translocase subunit SecE
VKVGSRDWGFIVLSLRARASYEAPYIIMRVVDFLREVKVELEKVVWPSRAQTIRLTMIVIIVTLLVGFFIGGLDYLLTELTKLVLR